MESSFDSSSVSRAQSPEMSARRVRKLEEAIERCMAFLRQRLDRDSAKAAGGGLSVFRWA
jgi:hypothetical protein